MVELEPILSRRLVSLDKKLYSTLPLPLRGTNAYWRPLGKPLPSSGTALFKDGHVQL